MQQGFFSCHFFYHLWLVFIFVFQKWIGYSVWILNSCSFCPQKKKKKKIQGEGWLFRKICDYFWLTWMHKLLRLKCTCVQDKAVLWYERNFDPPPKKIWNIFFLISHSIDFISQGPVIVFRNSDPILSAICDIEIGIWEICQITYNKIAIDRHWT